MKQLLYLLLVLLAVPARAQEDCRVKPEDMKALIARFNPFFSDHRWDDASHTEMARMGKDRLLIITQDGCKRHHIVFNLFIDPEVVQLADSFWVNEGVAMLRQVFWEDPLYQSFGPEFEVQFAEKLQEYGLNRQMNFPIGTRNFLCEVGWEADKGGVMRIEMISFIFRERIEVRQQPGGVTPAQDDGWKQP